MKKRLSCKNRQSLFLLFHKEFLHLMSNMYLLRMVTKLAKSITQAKEEIKYEITGISMLTVAVLSLVSLFTDSTGVVGKYVEIFLKGLAGEGRYIFPLVLAFFGIKLIRERKRTKYSYQLATGSALFALILTFIHLQLPDKDLFEAGLEGKGGGLIGGAVSYLLLSFFGRTGTYIIWTALLIINLVLITNISFLTIMNFLSRGMGRVWVRTRDQVADFVFTEEEEEETVPEPEPERKRPVMFDGNIFDFNRGPGPDEEVTEKEDDLPRINIYPEPIEKVIAFEEARERKIEAEKARVRPEREKKAPLPEISAGTFALPSLNLLSKQGKIKSPRMNKDITENVRILEETLESFGVKARVTEVSRGPAITRYELQPAPGVKVARIVSLADDIALSLAAPGVRIEAPIPGKAAVGIEVPNKEISMVHVRELLESPDFADSKSKLTIVLGKDIAGNPIIADLARMPHMLIAGATGSGKSVCMNTIITSILFKARPDEVKLIMIDPKMVELNTYNGIPHLISPVVTDPKKAASALRWAVKEMENRYELFARTGAKDIIRYNKALADKLIESDKGFLPSVVVIIDELADLMMVAPADVEDAICRLAQMARAAGIHLLVATQRPSVDVITGLIKANIPSRIAFAVSSSTDSRTILDMAGAEKLLGRGDMLFFPVGAPKPIRVQGAFLSDKEVEALVDFLKSQGQPEFTEGVIKDDPQSAVEPPDDDELFPDAVRILIESGQASISMLQRRLRIGYARAARLIDMMEERGIVGGYEGSKPRAILMTLDQFQRMYEQQKHENT